MKGIVLAAGAGSRMWPATKAVSKQLVPVGLQPLIYYPLSTLMLAGISHILVITNPGQQAQFEELLGDGRDWGVKFSYAIQPEPKGLAQAFTIAADCGFLRDGECACLILGDNIFDVGGFSHTLPQIVAETEHPAQTGFNFFGTIFAYHVGLERARQFGVVEFERDIGRVISVTEKPESPKSPYMIPGLYFFDHSCVEFARQAKPSDRGELEITSVMEPYIKEGWLRAIPIGRNDYWLDTGTEQAIEDAWGHVERHRKITGLRLGVPEEVAWRKGWIDTADLLNMADLNDPKSQNPYANYLRNIAKEGRDY